MKLPSTFRFICIFARLNPAMANYLLLVLLALCFNMVGAVPLTAANVPRKLASRANRYYRD